MITDCEIIENSGLKSGYWRIRFRAAEITRQAQPGQFVHVQIPNTEARLLRRPFSICSIDRENGILTVVYKVIGTGTGALSKMRPGESCSVMGPQGNGYPMPKNGDFPLLMDGGFGAAATLPIAQLSGIKGALLLGARSSGDVLLTDDYADAGYEIHVATQDGSEGRKGLVTDLLPDILQNCSGTPVIYACGPTPMLLAVGKLALTQGIKAYLSLDERMCCGVGACFGCVVRVKDETNPDGWRYSRSCKEGPVYKAEEVYYGN